METEHVYRGPRTRIAAPPAGPRGGACPACGAEFFKAPGPCRACGVSGYPGGAPPARPFWKRKPWKKAPEYKPTIDGVVGEAKEPVDELTEYQDALDRLEIPEEIPEGEESSEVIEDQEEGEGLPWDL
jgi:hypothetical protein